MKPHKPLEEHIEWESEYSVCCHLHNPQTGEDAQPICGAVGNKSKEKFDGIYIGVFDGMGGAGSSLVETPKGQQTEAAIAATTIREALLDYLRTHSPQVEEKTMQTYLKNRLDQTKEELGITSPKLRSSMLRTLPTTMAMMWIEQDGQTTITHSYWAGDSRNYVMLPDGLHPLSVDDVRCGGDTLYNLHNDPPLSNVISQSHPFHINHLQQQWDEPIAIITCTDGCFGYLPSPMHFEYMLLHTLMEAVAKDNGCWAWEIEEYLTPIAGDDFSFVVGVLGTEMNKWAEIMRPRYQQLKEQVIEPYEHYTQLLKEIPKQQTELWEQYKENYEKFLPK